MVDGFRDESQLDHRFQPILVHEKLDACGANDIVGSGTSVELPRAFRHLADVLVVRWKEDAD